MKRKTAKANVRTRTRLLSLLLAVLMTFFCFPVTALGTDEAEGADNTAQENTQSAANTAEEGEFFGEVEEFIPWELELEEGDLDLLTLKTAELDPSEKPEIISASLIEEKQHVNRLYEQEPDVFTIMFQNRDGGKTVYVFSHPVKTVSPSGVYTDMTAAQIQAAVNSTAASTNATGIASSSLSLTASGSKMQIALGSDFIKSRLGNLDAEKPIMSYNIGELVIFKARASTLTNGISDITYDVTDEAREWATPGSEVPKFTFVPEISDTQIEADDNVSLGGSVGIITPTVEEEIVVMSLTVSDFAGECAIKGEGTDKYLRYRNNTLSMLGMISSPYSKWLVSYHGSNHYSFTPLSKQNCVMIYDDENSEISFVSNYFNDEQEAEISYWNIEGTEHESEYNFKHCNTGKYLTESLNGSSSEKSIWSFSNRSTSCVLLQSVSIGSETVFLWSGDELNVSDLNMNLHPINASYTDVNSYFTFYSTDTSVLSYEDGYFCSYSSGVVQIYGEYLFNDDIVSNTITVIVSDDYDITSGAVYLIRPYETTIDSNTKLLTMNINSNSLSLSGWDSRWKTSSQAFTITESEPHTYLISAILAMDQYDTANFSVPHNETGYTGSYDSINKLVKNNTLSMTSNFQPSLTNQVNSSNQSVITATEKWYIYVKNSKYYIVNASQNATYYFSHSNNSVEITTEALANGWSITPFGIDAPLIKQVTDYFCGVATTLQVLCAINLPGYTGVFDLGDAMWELNDAYDMTTYKGGTRAGKVLQALDAKVGVGKYLKIDRSSLNIGVNNNETLKNALLTSFSNGSPVIANVWGKNLSYINNDPAYLKHFICVMGYDELTGNVIVSDCSFVNTDSGGIRPHGIHIITLDNLASSINGGIHYRATI